jgi:uncharacterized membrane protein YcaP (DUF421 family)
MFAIRLMGKRQVGELQLSELVTTFMLSELAINPIQDTSIPIAYSLIPLVFLLSAEVITSFVMSRLPHVKRVLNGAPSILIQSGRLNQPELLRSRISISEFLGELRLKDVGDISLVDYAILEENGKLSVFLKDGAENERDTQIAHSLILDGVINKSSLEIAKKNEGWIYSYLKKKNLCLKDVFLMTWDNKNTINIILKEEK